MYKSVRALFILGFAAGGVYGAWLLLGEMARRASEGAELQPGGPAAVLVALVCFVGAVVGGAVGGLLLPRPRG